MISSNIARIYCYDKNFNQFLFCHAFFSLHKLFKLDKFTQFESYKADIISDRFIFLLLGNSVIADIFFSEKHE